MDSINEAFLQEQLQQLAELHDARQALALRKQAAVDDILAPLKADLAEVEIEFAFADEEIARHLALLEETVKANVLRHGASVKATCMQAIYNKGRVSWDSKALTGYSAAHPEILAFRSEGEPSVSLRLVSNGR